MTSVQEKCPAWTANAVMPRSGEINEVSHTDFLGRWVLLLWYPNDFASVCATEIVAFSDRQVEFNAINTQIVAVSCDSSFAHLAWTKLPRSQSGLGEMNIPLVSDFSKKMSRDFGVLLPSGQPMRACIVVSPDGALRQVTINDLPVGRSVDEALRLVKAFQFVAEHGEVCPANWQPGGAAMRADAQGSRAYFQQRWADREAIDMGETGRGATTSVQFRNLALRPHPPSSSGPPFSFSRGAQNMIASYQTLLQERPLQTKAATSCLVGLLGELVGSFLKRRRQGLDVKASLAGAVDWKRMGIFGFYGLAITGKDHCAPARVRVISSHTHVSIP